MVETSNSIPFAAGTDTSADSKSDDTPFLKGPEDDSAKPEDQHAEAEDIQEDEEDNGLIFGKFKTLEEARKGYKEAERAITKAARLEKDLRQYQAQAAIYEQDAIAASNGYDDRLDYALDMEVRKHELDNYALAAGMVLPPHQQLEVHRLIEECLNNPLSANINHLRQFFSPEVVAMASQDAVLYRQAREDDYNNLRHRDKTNRYNRKIENFMHTNGDWKATPARKQMLIEAMEITDGRVDLPALRKLTEAIESEAVGRFVKNRNAWRENSDTQDSLAVPGDDNRRAKHTKWLTKADFKKLTPQQETEKYDLIVEQIKLEKAGKLPRMLT